jgi:outer membrane receptor protein involved in Fe transport
MAQGFRLSIALLLLLAMAVIGTAAWGEEAVSGAEAPEAEAAGVAEPTAVEEEEEVPEIAMEVVGVREGLLSISPAPGESVAEVDAQEIEDSGGRYVMEAIALTPSVFVRHQGARYENRLSIRGSAPRLVLLDGIPVAREGFSGLGGGAGGKEAGFAGRILYTLPADIIERIDVIRSAGTIVYGQTAATGAVVNIVTKEPEEGEELTVGGHYGSYDQTRGFLSAGVSDSRLAFYVHGSTESADSHLPLGEKRFTDAFGKLTYDYPDGSKLLFDFFYLDGRRRLDLSQDFSIVPARYWEIDPWQEEFANLVYSKALDDKRTLDVVLYRRDRDFTTDQYTNDSFTTLRRSWMEGQDDAGIDLRYSAKQDSGRMTRAGIQWSEISSATTDTTFIGPGGPLPNPRVISIEQDRETKSAFYQDTIPLRSNTRLSLGVRYDDPEGYDDAFSYSAGIEVDVSPKTNWHFHAGTGKENPLPTDGDVLRGIVPPEASTMSVETGWRVSPDAASTAALNVFWTKTDDARILYNDPPGSIGPTAYISKPEDLTTWGVELIYDRMVSDTLSWFANYTYMQEDVSNKNQPLIPGPLYPTIAEPPAHIVSAGVRADARGTRVALSAKYSSDYMALSRLMRTAAPVDSFLVFDLKLTRPVGDGELALLVNNLFDADYETMPAFPRPGRNYLASYSLSF